MEDAMAWTEYLLNEIAAYDYDWSNVSSYDNQSWYPQNEVQQEVAGLWGWWGGWNYYPGWYYWDTWYYWGSWYYWGGWYYG